jgi:hypothetical protein
MAYSFKTTFKILLTLLFVHGDYKYKYLKLANATSKKKRARNLFMLTKNCVETRAETLEPSVFN